MSDKFKDSRARKLLQLVTNKEINNEENTELDHVSVLQENTSASSIVNAVVDTVMEDEPHCSYKTSDEPTDAEFLEDDDDSVKDPHYRSSSLSSSSSSSTSSSSSSSTSTDDTLEKRTTISESHEIDDNRVESVQNEVNTQNTTTESLNRGAEDAQTNDNSILDQNEIEIKRGKKRLARRDDWLSNQAKRLRNTGKAYISRSKTKKVIRARALKPPCGDKCKIQCAQKINEEARKKIFTKFWDLGDINHQRNFINNCTKAIIPKVRFTGKENPRNYNNAYYFNIDNVDIRVCKNFFMATLDINDRVIRTVFSKREDGFVDLDKRGKHGHHRKVDEAIKQSVRDHINSIPRIEGHYIRKNSSREYIDGGKCLSDLHFDYKKKCSDEGKQAAHYEMYSKIFNEEYNISFFVPKKDKCELCVSYENADVPGKEKLREKYMEHLKEKGMSRQEKESDKMKAGSDYIVAVYDLQAVLQCPKGDVSVFYYKSKLNNLNFTVSELGSDHTECYLWHEGEAARGADEIGSCVLAFIDKIMSVYNGSGIEFIFYSDNCCGQQKNQFIFSMYIFSLMRHPQIKSITHKYLVTGHTQNEGDSVHSTIEKAIKKNLKSGPIYVPSQYAQIIRTAKKKGKPYIVNEMSFFDFYSLKTLSVDMGFTAKAIRTTDIKVFKIVQNELTKAYIKYSYSDDEFTETKVIRKSNLENISIKRAYKSKPKIKENKKKDLMSLIEKHHIPNFYASFFENL